MKPLKVVKIKAEGVCFSLASSSNGKARCEVILQGGTRQHRIRYELDLTLTRCSYSCILGALQKFAASEKESVDAMAKSLGVGG